eukprot:TRINITY_DN8398_c0_g1_i5.p1 TRINITY_DN8398_c0_g1~~TRINITY_DN8398_c0_g1_i5.p1  ORF type:complete len:236 (-),score=34.66 TRINITY_DN8398_c0_g1_i5:170-877(-)
MENQKKLKFIITGFSSFYGVDDNPSALLSQEIASDFKKICNQELEVATILNVAGDDVRKWIVGQQHQIANRGNQEEIVWLHLGVDTVRNCYFLENRAINNATFRCPDNKNWCPTEEKINQEHPFNSHLYTDLDTEQIAARMRLKGFDINLSDDAGKFVCNWTYYLSLTDSLQFPGKWHSLFVHVPSLEKESLEEQKVVLTALVQEICILLGYEVDDSILVRTNEKLQSQPVFVFA